MAVGLSILMCDVRRWMFVCVVILALVNTAQSWLGFLKNGEMFPLNPVVEEGDTLILNCTLTGYDGSYNASSITFKKGPQPQAQAFPKDYVTVLSNRTAQLVYPNITIAMGNVAYYCHLPDLEFSVGQQYVRVALRPTTPVIDKCIVHNWEQLVCSWLPAVQKTGLRHNVVTLLWKYSPPPNSDSWLRCPHMEGNECTWTTTDSTQSFHPDTDYYVRVQASNKLGTVQSEVIRVQSAHLVKPSPVTSLTVTERTSTSIQLSWLSPKPDRNLTYKIYYSNQRRPLDPPQVIEVDQVTTVLLDGLHIYTNYNIQVQARSTQTPTNWSEPVMISAQTEMDLPGMKPKVTKGGFQVTECGADCLNIILYWQAVPLELYGAPSINYSISVHNIRECRAAVLKKIPSEITVVKGSQLSINVTSSKHCPLMFVVLAVNVIGASKGRLAVVVEESSELPRQPTSFLVNAESERTVHMEWDVNDDSALLDSHTVFWCRGSLFDKICQQELQWQSIAKPHSNYTLTLPEGSHYTNFLFGISKETKDGSSGILWSDCTYDYRRLSAPPVVNLVTTKEHKSLTLRWRRLGCSQQRGYIVGYTIFYCLVEQQKCTEPLRNVSVPGHFSYYTIRDLKPSKMYLVQMDSVTAAGHSHSLSKPLFGTSTDTWFKGATLAGVIVAVVAVIFIIAGLVIMFMI